MLQAEEAEGTQNGPPCFRFGDFVKWSNCDDDVPRGTVGTLLRESCNLGHFAYTSRKALHN